MRGGGGSKFTRPHCSQGGTRMRGSRPPSVCLSVRLFRCKLVRALWTDRPETFRVGGVPPLTLISGISLIGQGTVEKRVEKIFNHVLLSKKPMEAFPCNLVIFMDGRLSFHGKRINSGCLPFRLAKHGWKSFWTLKSFPAHIRDFKNIKGNWHQMSGSCVH